MANYTLSQPLAFTSVDTILHARGKIYIIEGVNDIDPRALYGKCVAVDGHEFIVAGVETYALTDVTGTNFGLLDART